MRPDHHDQATFDAIATELAAEDPAFVARTARAMRTGGPVRVARTVALMVAGLVALPVAAETGIYPLGVFGFAAAVLALDQLLGRGALPADATRGAWLVPRLEPRTRIADDGAIITQRAFCLRWQLVVGTIAVLLLIGRVLSAA
jgi:hypothetical protein